MSLRGRRRRTRRRLLVAGVLIVVGVVFVLIFSTTGQRPFEAPSEENPPEQAPVEGVFTPAGTQKEAKEGQPPEE